MQRAKSLEKILLLGNIEGRRRGQEVDMFGWHCGLNEHEFEQTLGDSEGQGSKVCCWSWGRRVRHDFTTEEQQSISERNAN